MKILYRISQYVKNNTLLFTVFVSLLVVAVSGALYSVNLFKNILINNMRENEDALTYTVNVGCVDLDESLEELLKEIPDCQRIFCIMDNNGDTIIADYYGKSFSHSGISVGTGFSETDKKSGANKVILPNYQYIYSAYSEDPIEYIRIGETYYIDGISYESIGMGVYTKELFQIPFESIPDLSKISSVSVVMSDIQNASLIKEFSTRLEELFKGTVIKAPDLSVMGSVSSKFIPGIIAIIAVLCLSLLDTAYIYSYILDTRRRENAICRMSGQTAAGMIMGNYIEIFIYSTVCYIISTMIIKSLLSLISEKGFLYTDSLSIGNLLSIYAVFAVFYSIVFLPAIVKHSFQSPAVLNESQTR